MASGQWITQQEGEVDDVRQVGGGNLMRGGVADNTRQAGGKQLWDM